MFKNTYQDKNTFYCFSPPVMIATFVIEIVLLLFSWWRYKLSSVNKLSMLILASLAIFQISEYFVCGGLKVSSATWSKIGYVAITALPPLGLHLMTLLRRAKFDITNTLAYASMIGFMSLFLTSDFAFKDYSCAGNYVIFVLRDWLGFAFGVYYYLWLALAILSGCWTAYKHKNRKISYAIMSLITGYMVFLLPTSISVIIRPDAAAGIPSIMCGFAVIFAILLPFLILPLYEKTSTKPKRTK